MNAHFVGLHCFNHFATNTKISPTTPESHCSREIGYRLFFGYYYTDGFRCPMTVPFSSLPSKQMTTGYILNFAYLLLLQAIISSDPKKT